jgi:hypothetical protein
MDDDIEYQNIHFQVFILEINIRDQILPLVC